jgi:hypothetical protein
VAAPASEPASQGASADVLRRGLLALAVAGTIGVGLELLLLRHWGDGLQLIPWVALAALAIAVVLAILRPRRSILVARVLAVAVLVTSVVGVFIHIRANYETAPLDFRYTDSWPTTSEPVRWFLAATDTVGASPSLAPTAMAFVALVLLLAMVGQPVTGDDEEPGLADRPVR